MEKTHTHKLSIHDFFFFFLMSVFQKYFTVGFSKFTMFTATLRLDGFTFNVLIKKNIEKRSWSSYLVFVIKCSHDRAIFILYFIDSNAEMKYDHNQGEWIEHLEILIYRQEQVKFLFWHCFELLNNCSYVSR